MIKKLKEKYEQKATRRIKRNINKEKGFLGMFLKRAAVLLLISMLISTAFSAYFYGNCFNEYAPAYESYGDKLADKVLGKYDYYENGYKHIDIEGFDSETQWMTSFSQVESILSLLCINESIECATGEFRSMISPVNKDQRYTGYWGVYSVDNKKFVKEAENYIGVNIFFNKEDSHYFKVAGEQSDKVMKIVGDEGILGRPPYVISGYITGDTIYIEKYKLEDDEKIYEMDIPSGINTDEMLYVDAGSTTPHEGWDDRKPNETYGYCEGVQIAIRNCWPCRIEVNEEVKQQAIEYINKVNNHEESEGWNYKYTSFNTKRGWFSRVVSINGEKYIIIYTHEYYLLSLIFWGTVAKFVAVAVVIALIIAYILANGAYRKYKIQREVNEYRRTLTNTMAHDLKSPLMVISGYAENLATGNHPEKQEFYTAEILKSVDNINKIIEGILELSKNEELIIDNKIKLKLADICREQVEAKITELDDKGLTVEITGESEVCGDEQLIKTVVRNLLDNAIKYSKAESVITIKLSEKEFCISNPIIDKQDKSGEELLKPFVRGDNARSGADGSGLGLAIVKSICDAHGMGVKVEITDEEFSVKISY